MKRSILLGLLAAGVALPAWAENSHFQLRSQLQTRNRKPETFYIVTAYCPCALCCGKANQPTACGKMPVAGVTCAGPRALPFGTHLNIPGVGERVVQDRTARRFDGRIDIFFATHAEAKAFGIRKVTIP